MNKEQFEAYSKFIDEPGIDGAKIADDLHGTPLLQDYDIGQWDEIMKPLDGANSIIPFISERIIKPGEKDAVVRGVDRIDAVFQAIQMCIHPQLSNLISDKLKISDNDALIIAGTHIGVTEISELYQISGSEDRKRLQLYAIYFAGAQAKILGIRTTTTLIALNLKDEAYLRLDNIAVIAKVEEDEDLEKAHGLALLEGRRVTQIRDIGKGKFFKAG